MSPFTLSVVALVFYAAAAGVALGGLRSERLRRGPWLHLGVVLGVALHSASIGLFCANSETHFFTSLSESLWLLSWALCTAYLVLLAGWAVRSVGAAILPLASVLLALSFLLSGPETGPAPANEAAELPVFAVHILSAFLGYALFLLACAASIFYLQAHRLLKRKSFGALFGGLPSLEKLERAATHCAWMGLALFTIAVGTGATMARQTMQEQWYLEPKIWASWATWAVFFVLVLGRLTGRLAGRATAKVILLGAVLVLVTLLIGHPFREEAPPPKTARAEVLR